MGLDIRIPLGYIFLVIGTILLVYGAVTLNSPVYRMSTGINLNLAVGLVMTVFGAIMRASAWLKVTRFEK